MICPKTLTIPPETPCTTQLLVLIFLMLHKEQQVVRESLISADSFWQISFSLFLSLFLRSRIDRCGDSMGPFYVESPRTEARASKGSLAGTCL